MLNRGASHLSGCERPTHRRAALRLPATLLCALAVQSVATAQHANTVLFGEPNPAGTALPAERTAVHPVTAPYFNEDAFVTSDLRAWYVQHEFGSTLGGSASVAALQIRVALTEDIQFVAYKDGFVDFKDNAIDDSGMNDLAAGIKWAFLQDWESDMHAAVGIGYELGIGDEEVLQDDDEVRVWASYNNGWIACTSAPTSTCALRRVTRTRSATATSFPGTCTPTTSSTRPSARWSRSTATTP
jgi:hypothetical protein